MQEIKKRNKDFDINKLQQEDAERIGEEIGAKVRVICDQACEKANKILNMYGMKSKMQIVIVGIDETIPEETAEKPKKKRGRPTKATNL